MMDPLRVKHVVNEVAAILSKSQALPNFNQHARNTCWEVATLLLEGKAGYDRLNIEANNYDMLRKSADLAQHAVLCAASRWNEARANHGDAPEFYLNTHDISAFVFSIMTDYEVYFRAHPGKVVAYAQHYPTVDAILAANVDVEAVGEPYEIAPLPLANGRIGCRWCNKTMVNMEVLEIHHKTIHQSHGEAACTECTWATEDRPHDLHDHMHAVHDIYQAGHRSAYSTSVSHINRKTMALLKRLLVEERATLATLRGDLPPPARVPSGWNRMRISLEISRIRMIIKTVPHWRAVVDRKRAKRVAQ